MLLLLALLAGGAALAASYARNIRPAATRTAPLTAGRVYYLILKNNQPGQPLPAAVAWGTALQGFSGPGAGLVKAALASDGVSYGFTFDWVPPDPSVPGSFSWDSAFYLEDQGSVLLSS